MDLLKRKGDPRLAIVAGVGRSGTHFLGRFFQGDRRINLVQESKSTYGRLKDLATSSSFDQSKYDKLVRKYHSLSRSSRLVVDKSHPSIWFVEQLKRDLPFVKFIATMRDPLQVVNSMLNHPGVLRWYEVLDLTQPLPFLGIDSSNVAGFADLPLYEKCVWKWISHARKIRELEARYPDSFRVYQFHDLVTDPEGRYQDLCGYLEIEPRKAGVEPSPATLTKFKELSDEQITRIEQIVHDQGLQAELQPRS